MTDPESVLDYWFGNIDSDGLADAEHGRRWFEVKPETDTEICERFSQTLTALAGGAGREWLQNPRSRLAYIVVCDQFSRNIHRGTARAFATDPQALEAARDGVALGDDRHLTLSERAFFYLPFEHSESIVDQHTCVGLFTELRDSARGGGRVAADNYLRHARQHRDVITRFRRFPHRNTLIGRTHTEEEEHYLKTASRFGQG